MSMEIVFANFAKTLLGEAGAKKLNDTMEGFAAGVKAIKEAQEAILRDTRLILMNQENLSDRIGRIEAAMRLPESESAIKRENGHAEH